MKDYKIEDIIFVTRKKFIKIKKTNEYEIAMINKNFYDKIFYFFIKYVKILIFFTIISCTRHIINDYKTNCTLIVHFQI